MIPYTREIMGEMHYEKDDRATVCDRGNPAADDFWPAALQDPPAGACASHGDNHRTGDRAGGDSASLPAADAGKQRPGQLEYGVECCH